MSTELTDNQVHGYKYTISNPRVSDGAKEHARKVPAGETAPNRLGHRTEGREFQNRHLDGKKATLTSMLSFPLAFVRRMTVFIDPSTPEGAKQQISEELDNAISTDCSVARGVRDSNDHEAEIHSHRVLGDYKATSTARLHVTYLLYRIVYLSVLSRTPT
jgi:Conidiation protein 6